MSWLKLCLWLGPWVSLINWWTLMPHGWCRRCWVGRLHMRNLCSWNILCIFNLIRSWIFWSHFNAHSTDYLINNWLSLFRLFPPAQTTSFMVSSIRSRGGTFLWTKRLKTDENIPKRQSNCADKKELKFNFFKDTVVLMLNVPWKSIKVENAHGVNPKFLERDEFSKKLNF